MKSTYYSLVSLLQKKFHIDFNYILQGGFWLTLSKAIAAVCTLATSVAFANYLPEETYGTFRYALSFFVLLSIFTLGGLDTSLVKAVAKGFDGTIRVAFLKRIQFGLISSIFSFIISGYYFFNDNNTLGFIFLLGALFVPLMEATYIYVAYLNGKKDFFNTVKYLSITRVLSAALLVGTVVITDNVILIIGVYLISNLILRIFFFYISTKRYPPAEPVDYGSINFGKHLTVTQGIAQVSGNLDKILIFNFVNGATLAGYYLALVPFKQINNLLGSLSTLAMPKMAKMNIAEMNKILPALLFKLYIIIIPIIASYWVIGDLIFNLFLSPYVEYSFLAKIVVLLLLVYPFSLLQTALTSTEAKNEIYQITLATNLIRIVLLLVAVPIYGMWGAVSVVLFTPIFNAILTLVIYIRYVNKYKQLNLNT